MVKFEHHQGVHELSLASIARLEAVLGSLRVAANQLIGAAPEVELGRRRRPGLYWRDHIHSEPMVIWPEHGGVARELIGAIEDTVQKIAGRLDCGWRRSLNGEFAGADRQGDFAWAIGAVTFCVEQLPILRGEVELLKTEPIAAGIPDEVVEFIVTVPGTTDQITRESHGHWGYHYHYIDGKGRRSDTLLTFDGVSTDLANPNLCWERHAEGGKFKARAGAWGSDKRQSVYLVCHPHASKFGLSAFKRPASDAEIVWPLASTAAARSVV